MVATCPPLPARDPGRADPGEPPVNGLGTGRTRLVVLQGSAAAAAGSPGRPEPRAAHAGLSRSPVSGPAGARPSGRAGPGPPGAAGALSKGRLQHARTFALLFLEVEAGLRPRRQLLPLMVPRAFETLAPVWVRRGPPRQLLQLALFAPDRSGLAAVALASPPRGRPAAIAFALRHASTGWLVTHAWRPEDGPLDLLAEDEEEDDW